MTTADTEGTTQQLPVGKRRCPSCKKKKDILSAFGYRRIRQKAGVVTRVQPWCSKCRNRSARAYNEKRRAEKANGKSE